jgi:putative holliday junction resolvase
VRYLCIDLGDKRTGLAAGDAFSRLASPLKVLEVPIAERAGESLIVALTREVTNYFGDARTAGELVIGMPFNMDGTEGPRAKSVRAFADRIAKATNRAVHFHDERLSSVEADWQMARSGLTHGQKKARRDALAAAAILQDFLRSLPPSASSFGSGSSAVQPVQRDNPPREQPGETGV